MNEQNSQRKSFDPTRLGWLQLQILTSLWDREMYGLEIQKYLRVKGHHVQPGQLYPALSRLENINALSCREECTVGAGRKYYSLTATGKAMVIQYLVGVMDLFTDVCGNNFGFFLEEVLDSGVVRPGQTVVDFSHRLLEDYFTQLGYAVGPKGNYVLVAHDPFSKDMLEDRIKYYGFTQAHVVEREEENVLLPSQSADIIFVNFTLHENGMDWILQEVKRVLKPDGILVVIEVEELAEDSHLGLIFGPILQHIPNHSRSGLPRDELEELLTQQGFEAVNARAYNGLYYLSAQKISQTPLMTGEISVNA